MENDFIEREISDLSDLFPEKMENEIREIKKMPTELFDAVNNKIRNPQKEALSNYVRTNIKEIERLGQEEKKRVLQNYEGMKIGTSERIRNSLYVERVPGGYIFCHEIYDNHVTPNVIGLTTTFVPNNEANNEANKRIEELEEKVKRLFMLTGHY